MKQRLGVLSIGPFTDKHQKILGELISLGFHSFSYKIVEEGLAFFQEAVQKSLVEVDFLICIGEKAYSQSLDAKFSSLQILWLPEDLPLCKELFHRQLVGSSFRNIAADLQKLLLKEKKTLALAESCTGGCLSHVITSESGSSQYFLGSFVTYSNELKRTLLGVRSETLENYGAVSSQTVQEMAGGVLKHTGSDFALAVSGVAGPTGGTKENPVGTVWFAIGYKDGSIESQKFQFPGDRETVIFRSSYQALFLLYNKLIK